MRSPHAPNSSTQQPASSADPSRTPSPSLTHSYDRPPNTLVPVCVRTAEADASSLDDVLGAHSHRA